MQVKTDAGRESEYVENSEYNNLDGEHGTVTSSTSQINLFNKLRAVEVEINAVASTIEKGKAVAENENENSGLADIEEDKDARNKDSVQVNPDGFTLQQALATDRLKSLKKTKVQLEKEISKVSKHAPINGSGHEVLLDLVKEKPKHKQRLKPVDKDNKDSKRRLKTVSYNEDADFDAVLDAASAGFIETVSYVLIRSRKGSDLKLISLITATYASI